VGTTWAVILGVGVLVVLAWYLSFSAARLDRLHARVEVARAALDAQLVRRASVALELATTGLLDPATSVLLADAAHGAREATADGRELAESDLSGALRAALDDPQAVGILDDAVAGRAVQQELDAAWRRVELARRFHNDAVRATRTFRRKRAVRYLHLAGHADWPQTFEMDDARPAFAAR
jgi:hypothetical protein